MAVDSITYEDVGEVIRLNMIVGSANTPEWTGSYPVDNFDVTLDGIESKHPLHEARHHGRTRRVRNYQVSGGWAGRFVRNDRQVSIAMVEDLHAIAEELEIVSAISDKGQEVVDFMSLALGVNLVMSGDGLHKFLVPGSVLYFGVWATGAVLDISGSHLPCSKPAFAIARELLTPNERLTGLELLKAGYKEAAAERRGFMTGVYSAGRIAVGDKVAFQLPIDHCTEKAPWKNE